MKKFLFIAAAAAALLTACQVKEELAQDSKVAVADEGIKFDVYTQRNVNTKGGIAGTNDNNNIGERGFGVFAYYTNGEQYDQNAKPNFMYNQKVEQKGTPAAWVYEPVKYWPNEYGNAAISDEIDYVTFFAYAPYVDFEPTTGAVVVPASVTDPAKIENLQKFNIVSVNKNSATGDPVIKYVVDTDPETSVDLLWGVAAQNANSEYSAITGEAKVEVTPGKPFIDMVKPADPKNDKLSFNLRHALAKVQFTIDYIADDFTPDGTGVEIDSTETRIFVRSFTMDGWALQGALNLNNETPNEPNWKDFDGVKDLTFNTLEFNDGRKDGKEGTANGVQSNEANAGRLNPNLVENHCADVATKKSFSKTDKNLGVYKDPQPLFKGTGSVDEFFYVIPRNGNEEVNMTIVYDVETIDKNLASFLSDGATNGISIENKISKLAVLGANTDIEAGKQYLFKIHLGMTSVKVEAIVTDWYKEDDSIIDLPDNQPDHYWTVAGVDGIFETNPANGIVVPLGAYAVVTDEAGWNESFNYGVLSRYYAGYPNEDRYNYDAHRWAVLADKVNDDWPTSCRHSWLGAICAPESKWPWLLCDFRVLQLQGKIKISYDGGAEIEADDLSAKVFKNYDCISLAALLGDDYIIPAVAHTGEDHTVGTPTKTVDPAKLVVKYYYTGTVTEHGNN